MPELAGCFTHLKSSAEFSRLFLYYELFHSCDLYQKVTFIQARMHLRHFIFQKNLRTNQKQIKLKIPNNLRTASLDAINLLAL